MLINWIPDSEVLDLFSGSGALGLEALSRGAKHAVLCDNSRRAIQVINENVTKLRMNNKAEVMFSDYKKALIGLQGKKFDIIFLDPPYKTDYDIQAIEIIQNEGLLKDDGIIVLETDSDEKIENIDKL